MENDIGTDAILRIRTREDAIEYTLKVLRYLGAKEGGLSKMETAVWKDRGRLFERVLREHGISTNDNTER